MYNVGQLLKFEKENAAEEVARDGGTAVEDHPEDEERSWAETQATEYTGQYELVQGNRASGYQEYGRGLWSVVYKATEITTTEELKVAALGIPTPPASPSNTSPQINGPAPKFLAIKAPIRRDAHQILENEARILTYLHHFREGSDYIVPFHGYEHLEHSVVLDAVPLALEFYNKAAAKETRGNFSTRTMFDPVIGISQWLKLCKNLIDGLVFLHLKKVVHGDIKPMNILLRGRPAMQIDDTVIEYQPLYCDFSSSHVNEPGKDSEEVSAVTTEFTAPELLQAFRHRNGQRAIATYKNDVFALGVTLLTAVTGENPYTSARFEGQKTAMAKEGLPLEFARRGEQASRVGVKGMVDMVIRGAVEKDESKRWTDGQWQNVVKDIVREDLEKRR